MQVSFRLRAAITSALGVFAAAAQAAAPAPAPSTGLEEVVVTAQRRDEQIQEVPIAVTAITSTQLERLNISQTLDLVKMIPNAFGSNNTGLGTANVYSIRGLNNTESIATFDPPVGTYVDDVFIARQNANNFQFFDVERVEVLRGPQGTLFGRNTTGGAINVILKKPQPEFGGYAEAGFGQFNEYMFRFSADVPLSDRFLTKLSAYSDKDDGYVWNTVTGEKLNGTNNKGVRLAARWLPMDGLTWDLAADYIDDHAMNILNNELSGDSARISTTGMRTDTAATRGIFVKGKQNYPLGNEVTSYSITSNIGWQTGIGMLNFITGWRSMEQKFALDFFGLPGFPINGPVAPTGAFTIANDGNHDQFTQEIKLTGDTLGNRLHYVTGAYYFDEHNKTDLGQLFAFNGTFGCPTGTVCHFPLFGGLTIFPDVGSGVTVFDSLYYDRVMKNTGKAWALYAQADYDITDAWTLTLGARYTDEKKTIAYTPNDNPNAPPQNQWSTADIKAAGIPTDQTTKQTTPRVALKYKVNDQLNFYASATNGFKSGGWNARNVNVSEVQPFKPEKVWSYELGMRSDWLDNRLRFNLTGFWQDVTDFQLPSAFTNEAGGIVFITRNFADLEVKGVEAEITWVPIDGLNLFANAGWQDGKYQNLDPSIKAQQDACRAGIAASCGVGIVDPSGKIADPVRLPDYTATVGGSYSFHLGGSGLQLTPNAYLQNVGHYNVETAGRKTGLSSGYTQWSAGLTLGNPDEGWSLSANCDNCSNEYILVSVLAGTQYYQPPRTWSVRFKYNW